MLLIALGESRSVDWPGGSNAYCNRAEGRMDVGNIRSRAHRASRSGRSVWAWERIIWQLTRPTYQMLRPRMPSLTRGLLAK